MEAARVPLGASAILRLAGCPVRSWLLAASPELFAEVARLNELADRYAALGAHLAVRLGEELVPHPALSRAERGQVLHVRRRLHLGALLQARELAAVAGMARHLAAPAGDALVEAVERAAALSGELAAQGPRVAASVAEEEERIARIALALVDELPALAAIVRDRNPELHAALVRARTDGPRRGKMLRRNGAYVWELLDRAALNSTPRDWHGHAALLHVSPEAAGSPAIAVTGRVGTDWCENLHAQRRELAARPLETATRLAPAPIHFTRGDRLCSWVVSHDHQGAPMIEVEMRRTPALEEIHGRLVAGARTLADLEAELVPGADAEPRELLRGFVQYLVQQGAVEVSAPLREELERWRPHAAAAGEPWRKEGFLDVYREAAAPLPLATSRRLEALVVQALRVTAAIHADRRGGAAALDPLVAAGAPPAAAGEPPEEPPRPLLDLVEERLARSAAAGPPAERTTAQDWPSALRTGSAYARLLGHLAACADEAGAETVDLDANLLDRLGAPAVPLDWPIDCVVRVPRPGCGYEAVFDEAFPAGSLDARFVTALEQLHGRVPHAQAHRRFLQLVEEASGVSFLEILVPPLSIGAANAVRRPIYTAAWTGDADLGSYARLPGAPMRYVPLDAIAMRRRGGRLRAEVEGRPVCPTYHATRIPLAPWNLVADLLLGAAPLPMRWSPRRLHRSLDAFPDRDHLPRITIARELVLAGRQWRLRGAPWDPSISQLAKVRALARLRRERGWPRWVFVSPAAGNQPRPCDLDSIRSIRVLEEISQRPEADAIVIEMIPCPGELLVEDQAITVGGATASAIMLRLPCEVTPAELAARVAPIFESWSR